MTTVNEYPKNDTEWREYILEGVKKYSDGDGYELSFDGSYCTGCSADTPIEPKVGMTMRLYGPMFGVIRGMFFNGVKVYYRTEAEQQAKWKQELEESNQKKREAYLAAEDDYNKRIAAMPKVYQDRIARFRKNNPDFNWKFLGYEMFCCEQSLVIADICKSADLVNAFYKLPWKEQLAQMPEDKKAEFEGHSGNTFGCACLLAKSYLTEPELVVKQHRAMVALVGCKEYGCDHE